MHEINPFLTSIFAWIERFLLLTAELVEIFGILVIVLGVVRAAVAFMRFAIWNVTGGERERGFNAIRIELGCYILFGLEILICADIVQTVVRRTMDEIILLSAIVIVRTIISFFLAREVSEARAMLSGPPHVEESADARRKL